MSFTFYLLIGVGEERKSGLSAQGSREIIRRHRLQKMVLPWCYYPANAFDGIEQRNHPRLLQHLLIDSTDDDPNSAKSQKRL